MNTEEFNLSPKFLVWLSERKNIDPAVLIDAYKKYREEQNYPFVLKEMRIAMQSNFKGLCSVYATMSLNKDVSTEQIWQEAKERTVAMFENDFWKEKKKSIKDMSEKEKKALDERNKKVALINRIVVDRSYDWLERVYKMSKDKEKKK